MDEQQAWREHFPVLSRTVYMISNSLGAMPRATADHLAEYAEIWATRGVRAWEEHWWEMARETGNRVARIINAPADTVSMHENVTTAHMVALSTLDATPRKRTIVCQESDFPSMLYLFQAQQRAGFDVRIVPAEPDLSMSLERMLAAIDDQTLVVCLSHVLFKTSYITEARAVIERAHQFGARVILDVYQSAGIIPVDVVALEVDVAVGGCLKWLCGGPGASFMYTRPDLLTSTSPRYTGWVAQRQPFEFDLGGSLRTDGMRMMNGTPSIPAYYAARAGLDIIAEVGVDRIRRRSMVMTARLLELADDYGFASAASRDPERLAGTVAVMVPHARHVSRALKAREVLVDYRPGVGIRLSPHFYNTMDEIDRAMAEIQDIVRTKAYDVEQPFESLVS
jgi:kynureninase